MEEEIFKYKRLALFGDDFGIKQLLEHLPPELVKCIVGAANRPKYHSNLKQLSAKLKTPLLVQPAFSSRAYKNFIKEFKQLDIDLIMTNSYSLKIRKDLLSSVKDNAINLHWSLLPKNRGPNPLQWAIIKGEKYTGVTVHYMDEGFDSGDIIAQKKVKIAFKDTWLSLREKIVKAQDKLLSTTLPAILAGTNKRKKQNTARVTTNKRLSSSSPLIHFRAMSNLEIYNLIRAQVQPLSGAYIIKDKKDLRFKTYLSLPEIELLRKKYVSRNTSA